MGKIYNDKQNVNGFVIILTMWNQFQVAHRLNRFVYAIKFSIACKCFQNILSNRVMLWYPLSPWSKPWIR